MQPYFTSNGLVTKALEHAFKLEHIMDLTRLRCLGSLFSMLHQACRNVAQYNANHPDFPMQIEQLERYIQVRTSAGAPSRPAACAPSLPCPGMPKGRAAVGTGLFWNPVESALLPPLSRSGTWSTPFSGRCLGTAG